MDTPIARYLPEFPPAPVPSQAAAAPAFGDPWAGLARAPRAPLALPVPAPSDAILVEPVQAERPPVGLLDGPPADWQDGLLPRPAKPNVTLPAVISLFQPKASILSSRLLYMPRTNG